MKHVHPVFLYRRHGRTIRLIFSIKCLGPLFGWHRYLVRVILLVLPRENERIGEFDRVSTASMYDEGRKIFDRL